MILCSKVAAVVWLSAICAQPAKPSPFRAGEKADVLRVVPCRAIDVLGPNMARPVVTFVAGGSQQSTPRVRIARSADKHVRMTVLDAKGAALCAPTVISGECCRVLPVFSGDLNGDGALDYIAFIQVPSRGGLACCDMGFALSSKSGYHVASVRRTVCPGARDFVDTGDGKCRFVHAELIHGRPSKNVKKPDRFLVYRLLEFRGGVVEVSKDTRFPRVARLPARDTDRPHAWVKSPRAVSPSGRHLFRVQEVVTQVAQEPAP